MLNSVQGSDPFKPSECRWRDPKCRVDSKDDCMQAGKTYTITCKQCMEDVNMEDNGGCYRGQTGRSMHSRMLEHTAGLAAKSQSCPLFRHKLDNHPHSEPEFVMKKSKSGSSNLHRLAMEAEEIYQAESSGVKLWNSKTEFGKGKLIRWTPTIQTV